MQTMNIYDIAAEAKTSISTVSRVLNNKGNVNPEIRQRVEEVLKKYDYKPSAIARGMVSKTMKSIAILTVDVRVTHYARMVYVIEQIFSNEGYNVTVCNTGGSISECGRYFEILSEKQVDGIVLIGSVFNELIHYPEMTARIKGIPVVVANGQVKQPDFYSVMVDDMKGIRSVVDYLYEKGHRDLLYLYDLETESSRAKCQGFLEAMKLGAAATYILTPTGVELLEAGEVPMGILNPVEPILLSKKLWDDNRIIMVSDGVLDALPGEDKELSLLEFIAGMPVKNPQDMADRILLFARSFHEFVGDDMTVLTAGIWDR